LREDVILFLARYLCVICSLPFFKKYSCWALNISLLFFAHTSSFAFSKDIDEASMSSSNIQIETQKFLDKTSSLNFDEIIALSNTSWKRVNNGVMGYHFLDADYWAASEGAVLWLKMKLPDSGTENLWLELLPNVGMDGKLAVYEHGKWLWKEPVKGVDSDTIYQPARYLTFLLDTSLPDKTAYIRLTTEQTFQFSLKAHSMDELPWYFMSDTLFFGLVAGMLLLAMIYNFAIGLNAKEPAYLYYALYVFCNLIYSMMMEGYFRLLFPEWGSAAIVSNAATIIVILSAILFVRKFLDTKTSLPRLDILLRGVIIVCVVWCVCLLFVPDLYSYLLTILIGAISPMLALIAGIMSYRQGHPMARYFIIAWLLFLISAGCWGWMWLGVIEPKDWVIKLYLLGTLLEVVLLSLVLGYRFSFLKAQTQTLHAAKSRYRELSETDELTGVLNRRGFVKRVGMKMQSYSSVNLVWLALDVDHFKRFNDAYGHPAGDDLLQKMGGLLNKKGRKENIVGRIGGEEFAILLVNCPMPDAQYFIDRLLIEFEAVNITTSKGEQVSTTLSIGVTEIQLGESVEQVWKRADDLLYKAKQKGRNRAEIG